jgi:hypothetical protein
MAVGAAVALGRRCAGWSVARSREGRPGGCAAQGEAASGEVTRGGQLCSAAVRRGKRERRGGKGV